MWGMVGTRQAPDRSHQKARTHQAIIEAAAAIIRDGHQPTVAEAAQAAGVHRATAYRYFPTPESLLSEAALTVGAPDPDATFAQIAPNDPIALIDAAVRSVAQYSFRNEAMFRGVVRATIDRWFAAHDPSVDNQAEPAPPIRETRRFTYIDRALAPIATTLAPDQLRRLRYALALVFGAEALIVTRDLSRLDTHEAEDVMAWAATTLIRAATTGHCSTMDGE